jgi:hypothetical protein
MGRVYYYIGPAEIASRLRAQSGGCRIDTIASLERWLADTRQECDLAGLIGVTFVVSLDGYLRIANRRSEHVACAAAEPVLSAGEMFVRKESCTWTVTEVSNLSTGYCPEPTSWSVVAAALDRIPLGHPGGFTREVVFRRCPECEQRNVVKDGWLVCEVCGADLPEAWNFGS